MYSHTRGAGKRREGRERRRPWEHEGRNGSDVATSQKTPDAPRSWKKQGRGSSMGFGRRVASISDAHPLELLFHTALWGQPEEVNTNIHTCLWKVIFICFRIFFYFFVSEESFTTFQLLNIYGLVSRSILSNYETSCLTKVRFWICFPKMSL